MRKIEKAIQWLGLASALLLLPALILTRVIEIYTRVNLGKPGSLFNNMESELFLVFIFLSIGAAYLNNAHVRVDILSVRFSRRVNAMIELVGAVFFVLPLATIAIWYGLDMTWSALDDGETAAIAFGAPARWVIVAAVPIGIGLFALSVLARTFLLLHSLSRDEVDAPNESSRTENIR
ncbi:MAG: TRAP transporter small permease subunit [Burkholderiaceae bacterium]